MRPKGGAPGALHRLFRQPDLASFLATEGLPPLAARGAADVAVIKN